MVVTSLLDPAQLGRMTAHKASCSSSPASLTHPGWPVHHTRSSLKLLSSCKALSQRSALSSTRQAPIPLAAIASERRSTWDVQAAASAKGLSQRVAYQGVPGAYSEMASMKACPEWEHIPCDQFEMVFQALTQWNADRAVLPIENSLGGSIHAVFDLLIRYRLHIVGEVSVRVDHCLLALPGVQKTDLKRVISHPQALAQTDNYLRSLGVAKEEVYDTAGAAREIALQGWRDVGAIASRRAGELYGLEVLQEGVQDTQDNITRFLVLSREPVMVRDSSSAAYKTSIVCALEHGSGQLWKALSVFALRNIDMTKIESRPMRAMPIISLPSAPGADEEVSRAMRRFNFMFFFDIVGSTADEDVQNALKNLQEYAPFVRVLGSYPMDTKL